MFFFLINAFLCFCSSYWEVGKEFFGGDFDEQLQLSAANNSLFGHSFSTVRCYVRDSLTASCAGSAIPSFLEQGLSRTRIYLAADGRYLSPDPAENVTVPGSEEAIWFILLLRSNH